jgi:nucleoside-diphosphate-sugar epimerase
MGGRAQMKFLIIGGLGYIGQVLQRQLKEAKHEFNIVDNDLMDIHSWGKKLDITNYEHLKEIGEMIGQADVVVNLASIVGDQACVSDTRLAIKINCEGIKPIVELCNKFKKKLVHISTCSLYGASEGLLNESSSVFPVDFYGQTKYQQERYVLENSNDYCVFRLGTLFGWSPRMRFDLVVNTFVARAFNGEDLSVNGGAQWRTFVHIKDVARGIIFASEKNLTGVYNLCNDNITIEDLAKFIAGKDVALSVNEYSTDPRSYRVSNEKILSNGFKFEWDLKRGIEEMKTHENELKNYKNAAYSNYKLQVLKHLN